MKSLFNFLSIAILACTVLLSTSCKDDEVVIDPGTGLTLADGFYLAAAGADPVAGAGLSSESVEDASLAAQDRNGFVAGFMFLDAGDYNLVSVTAREITETIGGTATTVTDEGSACDFNDYTLVETTTDGAAISVGTAGLYKVTYDPTTSEMTMYQIVQPGLMGNATPGGWGADTPMTGSATATGASYSVSDVILRAGEFKIRFNCRWTINRRVDSDAGFGFDNGYQMFTNFGGTITDLQAGASNIPITLEEEGVYTITADWDPTDGWSLDLNKTGDVVAIAFDPAEHRWGAIGDATANGWDAADRNMYYKGLVDDAYTWYGVITFADAGEFKFRINDAWDLDLGGALAADGVEVAMDKGGANIASPGAGAYFVTIKTADEGESWTASMTNVGWGLIGAATSTGWDSDTDMTADGFVDGITTYSITADLAADEYKFRANDDWAYNLGGDPAALEADGGNLSIATAGTYTITLSYDGETYSASVN